MNHFLKIGKLELFFLIQKNDNFWLIKWFDEFYAKWDTLISIHFQDTKLGVVLDFPQRSSQTCGNVQIHTAQQIMGGSTGSDFFPLREFPGTYKRS